MALAVLLVGTAVFYLWDITVNGSANTFYAGSAWAGSRSWKALFFGSLDPSNFITVDKPPVSQWVMGLSTHIFGYSSASLLIPEALMGVATVALVYAAVTRLAGRGAGLVAGTAMALTPVAVMMFRFDNPDAAMVLLMTAAAYCTVRATGTASMRWLALAGVAVGFAFLAKMLEGLMVLPALGLVYLVAAPTTVRRRIVHLLVATVAMVVSAGWYVLVTIAWPASSRPYIAGSTDNSFMNLVLGYNGLERIEGKEHAGAGAQRAIIDSPAAQQFIREFQHSGAGAHRGGGMFSAGPGITRLFDGEFGVEISWLLPAALVALVVGLVLRGRAPRTDPARAGLLLFGAWLLVDGIVLSYMKSNPHPYYSMAIAPPIAAVVGLGVAECLRGRRSVLGVVGGAAIIAAAGGWSFVLMRRDPQWQSWLAWTVLVLTIVAVVAILGVGLTGARRSGDVGQTLPGLRGGRVGLALGGLAVVVGLAGLAAPAAYSAEVVATAHTGGSPSADPSTEARAHSAKDTGGFAAFFGGTTSAPSELTRTLQSTHTRWAAAISRSSTAAGLELSTRTPIMAIGGFTGSDPAPTLPQFEKYVADGDIGYYIATGTGGSGRGQSAQASQLLRRLDSSSVTGQIQSWVEKHYTGHRIGQYTVYDLRTPR
ncbi:ArnT family glycosyltransferase [Williamsia deligens]|uniref:ArnT family glycosyltransferase n=1 Tax=Williamsia deligens TaxID=321325 RepID=A0ABW3G8X6_9NOCA|nr:glycosyltransferase family 39 protein [Williamsia deligens]MCP2192618.1 4-amino-4-deoxy-L-arabinose transferase [Williamsia deligens]